MRRAVGATPAAGDGCPRLPPTRLVASALAAALAVGCGRPPAREPSAPAPAPRVPSAARPAEPTARRADFQYAPGAYRYQVVSRASVELLRDSTAPRPTSLVDTVITTVQISYEIANDGVGRRVAGSVDSFTVQSTGLVPTGQRGLAAPLAFTATLGDGRVPAVLEAHPDTACAAPDAALLALARDLLVPAPQSLAPGSAWSDTVTSTVCRASIPVTTRAVRSYRVVGPALRDGMVAVQLTRGTELTMTGAGTPRGDSVTVTGTGRGSGALFLDATGGRYLGGEEETVVELTVSNGTQTRRFVQRARQETRLLR